MSSSQTIPTKPKGFNAVTATVAVTDVDAAIAFYAEAFGADTVEALVMPATESTLHAAIKIAGTTLVLTQDANAQPYGGTGSVTLHHYLDDVTAAVERLIAGNAVLVSPVASTWWGEDTAIVVDPFGVRWSLAQRVEQLNAAERKERLVELYALSEVAAPEQCSKEDESAADAA